MRMPSLGYGLGPHARGGLNRDHVEVKPLGEKHRPESGTRSQVENGVVTSNQVRGKRLLPAAHVFLGDRTSGVIDGRHAVVVDGLRHKMTFMHRCVHCV